MVEQDEIDAQTLISPRTTSLLPRGEISFDEEIGWAGTLDDYIYLGAGKNVEADSTVPLAYNNPDRVSGDINVLFADGHVGRFTREAAAQLLGITIGDPTQATGRDGAAADVNVLLSQLNLRLIGLGAYYYGNTAVRNGLSLPLDMGTISQFEDLDPQYFLNPPRLPAPPPSDLQTRQQMADWVNSTTDYIYVGGHKTISMPPYAVVAYENPATMRDGIDLLRGDLLPQFREMRWAIETILADRARFPRSYL